MQRALYTRGGTLVLGLFFVIFLVNQVKWCEFADSCQTWPSEDLARPKASTQTPDEFNVVPSPQPVGDVVPQPGKDSVNADERTDKSHVDAGEGRDEDPINADGREDLVDKEDFIHEGRFDTDEGSGEEDSVHEGRPDADYDSPRENPGDEEDSVHEGRPDADYDPPREDPGDEEDSVREGRPDADYEDPEDKEDSIHEGQLDADYDSPREDPGDEEVSVHEGRPDADYDSPREDPGDEENFIHEGLPDADEDDGPADSDESNVPPDADKDSVNGNSAGSNEGSIHADDIETPEADLYDFRALLPKNTLSPDDDVTPTKHTPKNPPYTIVTTASENHFCPLNAWIYQVHDVMAKTNFPGDRPRIVVYDLGLLRFQRKVLHSLKNMGYIDEVRTFKFAIYPPHMDVHKKAGEYAWKPVMISEVARDYPGIVLWMDSGSIPKVDGLLNAENLIKKTGGFAASHSSGTFLEWTHPGVFDFYGDDDPERFEDVKNCNAAEMLWDTRQLPHILYEWLRCALHKDCIGPKGSSRSNHRQDQAVLTYILVNNGLNCNLEDADLGIMHHHDDNCDAVILEWQHSHGPVFRPTAADRKEIKEFKHKYRHKEEWNFTDLWIPGN